MIPWIRHDRHDRGFSQSSLILELSLGELTRESRLAPSAGSV